MKHLSRTIGLFGLGLLTACAALATDYKITRIDPNGSTSTNFLDINNLGQIVGQSLVSEQDEYRAFILQNGQYSYLNGPSGALGVGAFGISDNGAVVGNYYTNRDTSSGSNLLGPSHGFIYAGGAYTTMAIEGAYNTLLGGISPDGRYVSGTYDYGDADGIQGSQGFIFDRLTNTRTFVGAYQAGVYSSLRGINNLGQVAGWDLVVDADAGTSRRQAFLYDIHSGTSTPLVFSGLSQTRLTDINDNGLMLGYARGASSPLNPFVGSPGSFQELLIEGANMTFGGGINNANDVVGFYTDALGINHGFIATTVPEPQTWALFLAGAGLLMRRRRAH
ncbi:PEP-CTERM sorting domain-containing protein [Paucibacter sp. KBW04]|uniref:PEP-CTERM sorting domain-containing protein n=1 Tax=Paucibacter sp. KBW04 TaxID=2153361 RepID=UPI0018CC2E63|nr:PEP-CTERM sorting domain-containing protein [Paucibacter sp. KBW04]